MKKIVFLFATVIMIMMFAVSTSALEPTGQCGDNIYWNYNQNTGELVVEGSGRMNDYSWGDSPFYESDIKTLLVEYGVETIGDGAFISCTSLDSISIANTVTRIGKSAFNNCVSLKEVIVPDSVTNIAEYAFSCCSSLINLSVSNSVESIDNYAFSSCVSLPSITIPNSVTSIGGSVFRGCSSLTSITIPNSVPYISEAVFADCTNLTSVIIPDSIKSIRDFAFSGCVSLNTVKIPNSVVSIGQYAFCLSGLTNIMLPESVTEIGDYAFDSCSNLTNITLPENLISLGDGVFYCCKSLISLDIPENITSIGMYAFGHCYSLKNIIIPESISIIKQGAFSNCIGITDIIIPNGITNIDESLLFGCTNLKSVAIPQSVINIGEDAFANCTSLVDVYYSGSKAQWHDVKIHNNNEALENANIHFFGEENSDVTHKHSYTSSVTKTATCTETGTTTYTCTCGDTYTETIPATNHPNATTDAGKAPTTTEVGYTAGKYCPDCETWLEGHEEIPMLETHEHQFAQVDIKHSTCTETGVRYYECYCGAKREEEIPMMEHVFVYDGYEKWPTCTEEGIMRTECSCGKVSQEIIPANGHSLAYYIAVEATCTKDGLSAGSYCPDCDLVYEPQVVIPALGHDMQYQLIKATLTKGGVYNRVCKNCNSIKTIDLYPLVNGFVLSDDAYTYNGKVKTPGVTVKDETGLVLVEGKDYTLTYESGRKNPGKYTVKVTLMGNYEGEKELEFSILPGKTSKITATQSTSSIKLTWKKVTGADGYRVYQYNSKTGKYKTLKTLTGTTYTVKNLKAGTSYKFAVKAYTKADGETLWAASSKTITTCTKPATPTVKVTAGSGKATLSWSKVTGATGYVIYMEDSFGDFEKVTSTTKTSYTKKSLKKGKTYKFRVKAYKKVDGKYIYSGYKTYSVKVK